jgi:SAM-dependent methyltransferase
MNRLLFPGRHHLLTNFQLEYLTRVICGDPQTLLDINGRPLGRATRIDTVLWAVTSANHSSTRRNPLPAHRREVAIEEFADQLDAASYVFLIDDIGATLRFAEYVLTKIEVDSQGRFRLTPEDTLVACSTPEVIALYEKLGFRILPVELADRQTRRFSAETPYHLLDRFVQTGLAGVDWRTEETFVTQVARATRRLYEKYDYGTLIIDLHRSPLLTDDGDLTETRDYNTYVRAFDEGARRKYELVRNDVLPGRIVDIGCFTGALLRELSHDDRFRESDLFGIEVARQLFTECQHRKQQGDFGNDHVFFYQKDFAAGPIFSPNSVNTFLTFSLTHEIESYAGRDALQRLFRLLHEQLALSGRWINVDVVGPDDKQQLVYCRMNSEDGRNHTFEQPFPTDRRQEFTDYLNGLSTYARFLRFAHDFRRQEGDRLQFRQEQIEGQTYVVLRLQDACEFLSKKDYTDNWHSEMHETFCFWSFGEWKQAVEDAGFRVHPVSRAFTNPWLVENRYRGRVDLFVRSGDGLEPLGYPVTNMLLVAEKVDGSPSPELRALSQEKP